MSEPAWAPKVGERVVVKRGEPERLGRQGRFIGFQIHSSSGRWAIVTFCNRIDWGYMYRPDDLVPIRDEEPTDE